jgi:hypothetical protein
MVRRNGNGQFVETERGASAPAPAAIPLEQESAIGTPQYEPEVATSQREPKANVEPQRKAPETPPADDDADIRELWTDDGLSDPLAVEHIHIVKVGKPKDFFRTDPRRTHRRQCEILVLKSENSVGDQYYIIGPKMQGKIEEARPCTLVTAVDRLGIPRLWPLKAPRDGENDNDAWITERAVAREGLTKWVKLLWRGRAFHSREAEEGYAPDPDFEKLPAFSTLVRTAFGDHGTIRDESHRVYRDLFGKAKRPGSDADPFC